MDPAALVRGIRVVAALPRERSRAPRSEVYRRPWGARDRSTAKHSRSAAGKASALRGALEWTPRITRSYYRRERGQGGLCRRRAQPLHRQQRRELAAGPEESHVIENDHLHELVHGVRCRARSRHDRAVGAEVANLLARRAVEELRPALRAVDQEESRCRVLVVALPPELAAAGAAAVDRAGRAEGAVAEHVDHHRGADPLRILEDGADHLARLEVASLAGGPGAVVIVEAAERDGARTGVPVEYQLHDGGRLGDV